MKKLNILSTVKINIFNENNTNELKMDQRT